MALNITLSEDLELVIDQSQTQDKFAEHIDMLKRRIREHEVSLRELNYELQAVIKARPAVIIKWRESVKWCLDIDSENHRYFLKSTPGVYTCIAYKYKVDPDRNIKNKIAITLASLYKEGIIGRIEYNGVYLYGLTKFFNDDLTDLKEEYKDRLETLVIHN